jgi:nitrogen fixation/metabolism regulation signal transduction histidine kinase
MANLPTNWSKPDTPQGPPRRRSLVPILITIASAFLLFVASAYGALLTCGSLNSAPRPEFTFYTWCAVFFLLVLLLAIVWLVLSLVIRLIQHWRNPNPFD